MDQPQTLFNLKHFNNVSTAVRNQTQQVSGFTLSKFRLDRSLSQHGFPPYWAFSLKVFKKCIAFLWIEICFDILLLCRSIILLTSYCFIGLVYFELTSWCFRGLIYVMASYYFRELIYPILGLSEHWHPSVLENCFSPTDVLPLSYNLTAHLSIYIEQQ